MTKLILYPSDMSQWHALVNEAQLRRSCSLTEDLESYLVFLLMRFVAKPQVVSSVLAMDFLNDSESNSQERQDKLRELGDKSLLFSGLFPGLAKKRCVDLNYFITIGQSAYGTLSSISQKSIADLFSELCDGFLNLMNVLQAMREISDDKGAPLPETMLELWQTAPNDQFLNILQHYTEDFVVLPASPSPSRKH